jgi:hypothetical protein
VTLSLTATTAHAQALDPDPLRSISAEQSRPPFHHRQYRLDRAHITAHRLAPYGLL